MKKFLMIIVVTVAVIGLGLGVWFYMDRKMPIAMETVLPSEPLIYVKFSDTQANWEKFSSTQFWHEISSIDYQALMQNSKSGGKEASTFFQILKSQLDDPKTTEVIQKFLGQEVALAVYPTDINLRELTQSVDRNLPQAIEGVLGNVFFVTRISPDMQSAEAFASLFKPKETDPLETTDYEHHTLYTVTIPDVNVKMTFVRIKSLIIVGIGESAVKTSVDVVNRKKLSLAKDPQFKLAQARFLKPSSMTMYINLSKSFLGLHEILKQIASLSNENGVQVEEQLSRYFGGAKGLETLALSTQFDTKFQLQADVFLNSSEMTPSMASFFDSCHAVENKSVRFVPAEVVVYYWTSCFGLENNWNEFKQSMALVQEKDDQSVSDGIKSFEESMGLSIEQDVLPAFADEVGGYMSDLKVGGVFPMPELLFFIKIKDQAKTENLLLKLAEKLSISPQTENYNNIEMSYLTLPVGGEAEPSYCILDDYLLFANNRQVLKKSIDAFGSEALSLGASDSFKDVGLKEQSTGQQFVKVDVLMQKLNELLGWYNQSLTAADEKKEAFKAGSEKRLQDLSNEVTMKQGELKDNQEKMEVLKKQVAELQSQSKDTTALNKELNDTQITIDQLTKDLNISQQRKEDLDQVLKGYATYAQTAERRQYYMDQMVSPWIRAFGYMNVYGGRTTIDKNVIGFKMSLGLQ